MQTLGIKNHLAAALSLLSQANQQQKDTAAMAEQKILDALYWVSKLDRGVE